MNAVRRGSTNSAMETHPPIAIIVPTVANGRTGVERWDGNENPKHAPVRNRPSARDRFHHILPDLTVSSPRRTIPSHGGPDVVSMPGTPPALPFFHAAGRRKGPESIVGRRQRSLTVSREPSDAHSLRRAPALNDRAGKDPSEETTYFRSFHSRNSARLHMNADSAVSLVNQ